MMVLDGEGDGALDFAGDRLTVGFIAGLVAMATGVSARELAVGKRKSASIRARQIAMYLTHVCLSWPMGRVAIAFGRDRSTACHAVHRVEDMRDEPGFDAALSNLEAVVRQAPPRASLAVAR